MENKNEDNMICVKCGVCWPVFANRCPNDECDGFCSWGYELGKPLSYMETDKGILMNPPPLEITDETPESMKDYGRKLRESSHKIAKKNFDFELIFNFCQDHRVEVLVQDDLQYHCYIDYHIDKGKKGAWAVQLDSFSALIIGIKSYIEHESNKRS